MVNVMTNEEAKRKALHYSWLYNGAHSFTAVPFNDGYAVMQTDVEEPHYLCTSGSFCPINEG